MSGSAPGRREVAHRLFAAEFDDAEFSYSESDEERAPNYVVTPTGARVNRLFAVGVLTEIDDVNPEMVRGRVVDPTGAFVTYAGQYQPDALAFLERADPPAFLALSGKARTFEPDDDDVVYSSVRPESVNEVDAGTRDRWVVTAAERTLNRIGVAASAVEADLAGDRLRAALLEADVDDRLADGVALALEYYDTTPAYLGALRETALDAVRVVAGDREEVSGLSVSPDEPGGSGSAAASDLATLDLSNVPSPAAATAAADANGASATDAAESTDDTGDVSADDDATTGTEESSTEATADAGAATESAEDTGDAGEDLEDLEDFEPGEFDLDEETRQAVEEEYGTEFSTADEVEEADAGAPESEAEAVETDPADAGESAGADAEADTESEADGKTEDEDAEPAEESAEEGDDDGDDESAAVDLEDAVMEAMETVGDGEGADREDLIAAVADEHGVDPGAVEDAIQDALMSGRCYEPSDGTLKAI
jgi:RPA family protein